MPSQCQASPAPDEMRMSDLEILRDLQLVFDTQMYGLGLTNLKKLHKKYGLTKTHQQDHTVESIDAEVHWLQAKFLTSEMERIWDHLAKYCHKWVSWFRLQLHMGLDPFTGVIKWIKIWWTNRNLILICNYYLDVIEATGALLDVFEEEHPTQDWLESDAFSLVFHYIFIPFLQRQLDDYVYMVTIEADTIQEARQIYEPPDHMVFKMVPESFRAFADEIMKKMGLPEVVQECVWEIYMELLSRLHSHGIVGHSEWTAFVLLGPSKGDDAEDDDDTDMPDEPISAEQALVENPLFQYYGGINGGMGLSECILPRSDQTNING
ncbi:uncharacterized protein EV420DRAFT_1488575 [Desarmillaria tabescens]|uniref:Uncharacterized protein n=1 Tax=Armillaria tabescens TaxID=1929756 RepID=A0AA39J4G5_ARMTA|nr:uncharacterized protein EV420DRAFT_1488575 [Desarmillaria tabescens]KAK0434664.1 hypothetical protein EV420DRAFT_1488575 [Desarmillaria tabescens]